MKSERAKGKERGGEQGAIERWRESERKRARERERERQIESERERGEGSEREKESEKERERAGGEIQRGGGVRGGQGAAPLR